MAKIAVVIGLAAESYQLAASAMPISAKMAAANHGSLQSAASRNVEAAAAAWRKHQSISWRNGVWQYRRSVTIWRAHAMLQPISARSVIKSAAMWRSIGKRLQRIGYKISAGAASVAASARLAKISLGEISAVGESRHQPAGGWLAAWLAAWRRGGWRKAAASAACRRHLGIGSMKQPAISGAGSALAKKCQWLKRRQ